MKNVVLIFSLLFTVSLTAQDYIPIKRKYLNKLLLENDDSYIISCGFKPDGYNEEGKKQYLRKVKEDSVYDDVIICSNDTIYLFTSPKCRDRMTGLDKKTITSQSVGGKLKTKNKLQITIQTFQQQPIAKMAKAAPVGGVLVCGTNTN